MSAGAVLLAGLLLGLWPFDGDESPPAADISAVSGEAEIPPAAADVRPDPEAARAHYASYLALEPDGDPAFRAVALRRLADLTLERAEAGQAELGTSPGVLADIAEAAALYRRFLAEFPDDAAAGRARYQLARALELGGDGDAALAVLDALVTTAAGDALLPEAHFRRGEALFLRRRWAEAETAYAEVIELGPESGFYEQATYKHGWALFKQGRHEASLASFFAVLDGRLGDGQAELADLARTERELVDDSLRAVSIGFSNLGGAGSLVAYLELRPAPPAYERLLFERLGDLHLEQQRYQDAAGDFAAYVAARPAAEDAPLMQIRVVEAYRAGGFPALLLQGKIDYVERFGPDGGFWAERAPGDLPEAHAYLRLTLGELARHFHAAAQDDGGPAAYAEAARWYRQFLAAFPDDPEAPEHHFLLGEALFEAGAHESAAIAYEETAYGYPDHPRSAEAGYAALLAWRALALERPEGGARERAIQSALRFARTYPGDEHAVAVQTDAARELFELGRLEEAALEAGRIAAAPGAIDPAHRRTALLVLGHASFDLSDFAAAEDAYTRVGALLGPEDAERPTVRERLAASVYEQGRIAAEAGETDRAVTHYLRVKSLVPESPVAATGDFDAAMLLFQAARWEAAAAGLEEFRARYPGHALQDRVTLNLATAWREAGRPRAAAAELVNVSRLGSEDPNLRRAALWQAAEIYHEAGDDTAAGAVWSEYLERYPVPVEPAMEARQALVETARRAGDLAAERRWLEAIVAADEAAGEGASERTRTLAARALLALARPDLEAYEAIELTAPLTESVARKKALMEAALAGYGRAAGYGITDVTTEATYLIAQIYRHFGRALMASDRPAELDAAALEEYEFLLEEQAFPFEEQAIAIHEANAARAAQGIYDDWVAESFRELATLVPGRYARNERGEDVVRLVL